MTPEEFGELIRAHREAKGLGIEELASRFKLSLSAIRAMERGAVHDLPHAVYAKGFIRAYAQAVDVSPEELAAGLAALFPEDLPADGPSMVRLAPKPTKRSFFRQGMGFGGFFLILVILAALGGAGWIVYSNFDSVKDFVTQPFSALTQSSGEEDNETGPELSDNPAVVPLTDPHAASSARTAPQRDAPDVPVPPVEGTVAPGQTAELSGTSPENTVPQTEQFPPPTVSGNHIVIQAAEECWVQVAADGESARVFTIYPGESSILPYKRRLTLVLGNTGGVTLSHNGKAYPVSGKKNERRTFVFQ